jgi:hypothetical protein
MAELTIDLVGERLGLPTGMAHGLLGELYRRTGIDFYDVKDRVLARDPDGADPGTLWSVIADTAIDLRLAAGPEREAEAARLGDQLRDDCRALAARTSSGLSREESFDEGRRLGREAALSLLERTDQIQPTSSDYQWAAGVIAAVERRTGVRTQWNGRLYRETDPDLGGHVDPDGRMTLSERAVFGAVRKAYTAKPVDEKTALNAVRAVHYVTHEATHALGPRLEAVNGQVDPIDAALHESLAEDWTYRNRSSIVQDINLDRDVPETGPLAGKGFLAYGAYGNAGIALVEKLAKVTDQSPEAVSCDLLGTEPRLRSGRIVDLAMAPHKADLDRMPPADLQRLRAELVRQVRADYAPVVKLQARNQQPEDGREARRTGQRTIKNLDDTLRETIAKLPPPEELNHLHSVAFAGHPALTSTSKLPATHTQAPAGPPPQTNHTARRTEPPPSERH